MRILGIESSCDETSAAIVDDGRRVLSNVVASQLRIHRPYAGVVPELASRCHIEIIIPVIEEALRSAGIDSYSKPPVDAIAVTRGPGLIGALLVGVETAKTLAWRWQVPLIPVHHTMGHLHSVFCELPQGGSRVLEVFPEVGEEIQWLTHVPEAEQAAEPPTRHSRAETRPFDYPYLGLVVSGGHSNLVRVESPHDMFVLGSTLDDAPGEAYDKVAKVLGLDYPGGPEIDRRAALGDPTAFELPRPLLHSKNYDFSFSGLKTAVIRAIEDYGGVVRLRESESGVIDLCASFQAAVIDVLLHKAIRALKYERLTRLAVVGGVACNRGLRAEAKRRLRGIHLVFPSPILCTDNAAMIAGVGNFFDPAPSREALEMDARAGWELPYAIAAAGEPTQ